jgi:hypothetical protein
MNSCFFTVIITVLDALDVIYDLFYFLELPVLSSGG